MILDIRDKDNNIIGSLELPDDATEIQQALALSAYTAVRPPPETITRRQAKQALFLNGVTDATILAVLNSLPEPQKTLAIIEYQDSLEFYRHRPLVEQLGSILGWSSAQLDALWQFAATL